MSTSIKQIKSLYHHEEACCCLMMNPFIVYLSTSLVYQNRYNNVSDINIWYVQDEIGMLISYLDALMKR